MGRTKRTRASLAGCYNKAKQDIEPFTFSSAKSGSTLNLRKIPRILISCNNISAHTTSRDHGLGEGSTASGAGETCPGTLNLLYLAAMSTILWHRYVGCAYYRYVQVE